MGAVVLAALLGAALCASSVTAIEWRKPLVGNPAPDFKAQAVFNEEFKEVRLSDYIGKKCGSHGGCHPCMTGAHLSFRYRMITAFSPHRRRRALLLSTG